MRELRSSATCPTWCCSTCKLPGEDGLRLARFLRERYDVGIIMVTGAGGVVDRIVGLEVGADDYVAKPFDPRELLARVKSVLRRMQARAGVAAGDATGCTERARPRVVGALPARPRVAPAVRQRRRGGPDHVDGIRPAARSSPSNPDKVLSRDQLLTLTRNREWEPFDRSIDIRIARLRRKVEADPDNPQAIRTVRGVGYMFVPSREGTQCRRNRRARMYPSCNSRRCASAPGLDCGAPPACRPR